MAYKERQKYLDYQLAYHRKPENKRRQSARFMLWRYGISQEEYERRLIQQGGRCAICHQPPNKGKSLSVDHDHKTNRVRGLLCTPCNHGMERLDTVLDWCELVTRYNQDFI